MEFEESAIAIIKSNKSLRRGTGDRFSKSLKKEKERKPKSQLPKNIP